MRGTYTVVSDSSPLITSSRQLVWTTRPETEGQDLLAFTTRTSRQTRRNRNRPGVTNMRNSTIRQITKLSFRHDVDASRSFLRLHVAAGRAYPFAGDLEIKFEAAAGH